MNICQVKSNQRGEFLNKQLKGQAKVSKTHKAGINMKSFRKNRNTNVR